jgi:hypothetical protein
MDVNYGRGKTPTARTGRQDTDGATTGTSPGTLRAFTNKGAKGLNPDDVDGHFGPTSGGVINGDFPATLLAFDEDDEVFVQRLAGQPRRPRRCGDRQFPREAFSGA